MLHAGRLPLLWLLLWAGARGVKVAPPRVQLPSPVSRFVPQPDAQVLVDADPFNPFKANLRVRSSDGAYTSLLSGIDSGARPSSEGCPQGAAFVSWELGEGRASHDLLLGQLPRPSKLLSLSRIKRWWMAPSFGSSADDVPVETQMLLLEIGKGAGGPGSTITNALTSLTSLFGKESQVLSNKEYALLVPLIDFGSGFRGTLFGNPAARSDLRVGDGEGWLALRMESGDAAVKSSSMRNALYVSTGRDPYLMLEQAFAAIANATGTFRTREHKPLPPGIDSFGFCTWDAFYSSVDTAKVTSAIDSLAAVGFAPKFVIIDDGWQSTAPSGDYRSAARALGDGDLSGAQIDGSVALQRGSSGGPLMRFLTRELARFYSEKVEKGRPDSLSVKLWAFLSRTLIKGRLLDFFALNTDFSKRLTSWRANSKFEDAGSGRSLKSFVAELKQGKGVRQVFVWHALSGYWGGVSGEAGDEFAQALQQRGGAATGGEVEVRYSHPTPHLLLVEPALAWDPGSLAGVGSVAVESLGHMYERMHEYLAAAGIDGVKVDAQSGIGSFGSGNGGGVAFARAVVRAAEDSVRSAFDSIARNDTALTAVEGWFARLLPSRKPRGQAPAKRETPLALVGCMCHSTENLYNFKETSLIRASDDFYPRDRASQSMHLVSCAYNSVMLGEIATCDWDMFHSRHEAALMHAVARAISGGPVYVSDVPEHHDPALLRRLVLPNGEILRAAQPARPTLDCLFADVLRDRVSALKIFSLNAGGGGVIGVFNAQGSGWDPALRKYVFFSLLPARVRAEVQPKLLGDAFLKPDPARSDATGKFVAWSVLDQRMHVLASKNAVVARELGQRDCGVFAISHVLRRVQYTSVFSSAAPVPVDWAPIGLLDMFNPGGAVLAVLAPKNYYEGRFVARGVGRLGVYCSIAPSSVTVDGKKATFSRDAEGLLVLELEGEVANRAVTLRW